MNTAEILPLADSAETEEDFEVVLMVYDRNADLHITYNLSEMAIYQGQIPRIIQFLKDRLKEKLNASN